MHTLALTGSILRSDDAVGASYSLFEMNLTTQVDEQADGIVEIAAAATHSVQMAHLSVGEWFALRVITAGKVVEVTINGANTPFRASQLVLSDANITTLSVRNPDADPIVIQYSLGGT
jgi:hypothetical protein